MGKLNDQERRRFKRVPIIKTVELFSGAECWKSEVIDLSLKGVLLTTPDGCHARKGDNFRLRIPIENSPSILMSIQVVNTDEGQFGAEWQQIDMDSFTVLKRTLELNINDNDEFIQNMNLLTK